MATVLEECTTGEQRSVVCFFVDKGLDAKGVHKEMFAVYGGKCLSCKMVHGCIEKFSQGHSKVTDDAPPGAEVAETTAKRLLCCGFRCTGKAMGQVLLEDMLRNKCFFPGSNIMCFIFYIHL
jgi:hypothetical protein